MALHTDMEKLCKFQLSPVVERKIKEYGIKIEDLPPPVQGMKEIGYKKKDCKYLHFEHLVEAGLIPENDEKRQILKDLELANDYDCGWKKGWEWRGPLGPPFREGSHWVFTGDALVCGEVYPWRLVRPDKYPTERYFLSIWND